ncbi:MAG: phosphoglycerate mutase [Deltaproteobacteria bacterium]|nr:MAG: phosphoglycerate mutase [Deltaproteobacteria bacterium]
MHPDILTSLITKTDSKIVLLVMDGVGGLPINGKTELEAAHTPNLDRLVAENICGLTDSIDRGITAGSGPGHLGLFGYDPTKYEIGRGVLEALGVDLEMTPLDVAARGNFATRDDKTITDRRAGRIPTELNQKLCAKIADAIPEIDGVKIIVHSGMEHRFVVLFRGEGLDGRIADADPQQVGLPPKLATALAPEAEPTVKIINTFIKKVEEILRDEHPANTILLRGFAKYPDIPSMEKRFGLTPAAIATYPMYRGLAKLVGMTLLDTGKTVADEIETLKEHWDSYDFFFVHVKKTDSYGEDGNFDKKVAVIEEVDKAIPDLLALNPDVLVVTADHSTPSLLKSHSWHPNPYLLVNKYIRPDEVSRFSERAFVHGGLGRFLAKDGIALMLAHALKLKKFGA